MEQPIQQPVYQFPPKAPQPVFATGKGELAFALWTFVFSLCAINGLFYGGGALLFGLSLMALLGLGRAVGCNYRRLLPCGYVPDLSAWGRDGWVLLEPAGGWEASLSWTQSC